MGGTPPRRANTPKGEPLRRGFRRSMVKKVIFKRRKKVFSYRAACLLCGAFFDRKRQVAKHQHNYVVPFKDFLVEYPKTKFRAPS